MESNEERLERQRRTVWWLLALTGLGAILLGALTIALAVWLHQTQPLPSGITAMTGMGLVAGLLGLGLAWAGYRGGRGWPAARTYSRYGWIAMVVLTLASLIIGVTVPGELQETPLFALLHLLVIALPALILLSWLVLLAGAPAAPTFRRLMLALSGGAGAVLVAFPLEMVAFFLSIALTALGAQLLPGGGAAVERLLQEGQAILRGPVVQEEALMALLGSPLVLSVLALTLALFTPLIEELGKTLVLPFLGLGMAEKPGLARAFLWGAGCGIGFAMVEGVTNGALGLGEVAGWLGGVGARVLATGLHALTSGIMGLGWGLWWQRKRWGLPLAYLVAAAFHGLWNFNLILLVGGSLAVLNGTALWGLAVLAGVLLEGAILLATVAGLIGLPLLLRHREQS